MAEEEEKEHQNTINTVQELPTSIIIRNVPKELFEKEDLKQNFSDMFKQIEAEVRIDFLKFFQRVRCVFKEPEHATAAKLLVEHHSFNGSQMKAYFAQNIKIIKRAYQDEEGHLALPPLEKQFLISPPTSPPVGWTQCTEMAPVICDFDLMARLAAFTVEDNYELHSGDSENGQPAIVVTPALTAADPSLHLDAATLPDSVPQSPILGAKVSLPHTPRPP